jgi:hypothetical protein
MNLHNISTEWFKSPYAPIRKTSIGSDSKVPMYTHALGGSRDWFAQGILNHPV